MLDFGEAVRRFYGNYTNAEGRAQRSAYWWVQLYQAIIITVLAIVLLMADGGLELIETFVEIQDVDELSAQWAGLGASGKFAVYVIGIFSLVNFLPGVMIAIRRFHDLGQTGWLVLAFLIIGMLPIIGTVSGFVNFIWFAYPGTQGPNQYGPDPLGHDSDIFG